MRAGMRVRMRYVVAAASGAIALHHGTRLQLKGSSAPVLCD